MRLGSLYTGCLHIACLHIGCLLLAGCGGDGTTSVCFGTADFCGGVLDRNRPPVADAGADADAVAGEAVVLDGSGSVDADGSIASFSWTQRAGPVVTLESADRPDPRFIAPDVAVTSVLEFRLVVTDDDDASDSDTVQVTVTPADIAALQVGIALLEAQRPVAVDPDCTQCAMYFAVWLGARAAAADADDVDSLLDGLRMLQITEADPIATARLPDPARRLFELGQRELIELTVERDPALAEHAAGLAAQAAGLPGTSTSASLRDWQAALGPTLPPQLRSGDPETLHREALRLLAAAHAKTEPQTVAAAVLVLAHTRRARDSRL